MKELSIEEKAKHYDEALERARESLKDGGISQNSIDYIQSIFPELKESEDERIRERLIEFFKDWGKTRSHCWSISISDILAWLEKQGEQKVSVVEFNAKDWYVSKVDGKIYNAKFMKKNSTNLARKLEIEKAAMSATGIIDREEWFIKGAEWADENPDYISSEKQGEQKPGWSEDDEVYLNTTIAYLKDAQEFKKTAENCIGWLKSLKQRIGGEQ